MGDGADPGEDAAAQQRRLPQRQVIGIAAAASITVYCAKQATVRPCWRTSPPAQRSREVPSRNRPATDRAPAGPHSVGRPARQAAHAPHGTTMQNTT
jgi:hypothetical protein